MFGYMRDRFLFHTDICRRITIKLSERAFDIMPLSAYAIEFSFTREYRELLQEQQMFETYFLFVITISLIAQEKAHGHFAALAAYHHATGDDFQQQMAYLRAHTGFPRQA